MKKIGIYDSGCGGFTVVKKLLDQGLKSSILYFGDALNNPWGNKTEAELKNILLNIAKVFEEKGVTHVLTGCNTTVSLFKDSLSNIFNKPVITLFDNTIKHYNHNSYSILSTENSSKNRLFSNFLNSNGILKTQEIPCPQLANLIENNKINDAGILLNKYLKEAIYDNIILGCTHYPLLLNKIKTSKQVINPANYIDISFSLSSTSSTKIEFITTGNKDLFKQQISQYLNLSNYIINKESIDLNIKQSSSSVLTV